MLGLAVTFAIAQPGVAYCQAANPSPPSAPGSSEPAAASSSNPGSQIQEIVVTAQRRGQRLQDVPLSVTAFTGETLVRSGVTSIRDVNQIDPSVNVNQGSSVFLPFVRGVGNPATIVGNEASVPVYIDDVYYSRLSPIDLELANVQRVEVLKGPQGTLFGRNASGGTIQVFTRDPGSHPELEVHAGYGNYNTFSGRVYLAAPITNTIGASLSVSGLDQTKGWGHNLTNGEDTYKNKFINIRGKVVAEVTPTTTITLSGSYNHQLSGQGVYDTIYQGTLAGTPAFYGPVQPVRSPSFYDSIIRTNAFVRHSGYGGSLKIVQSLDFADLVSISAYRKSDELIRTQGNSTAQNYLLYDLNALDRQVSEELQLKSKSSSKVDWILGAFYLNTHSGYQPGSITGDAITSQGLRSLDIVSEQKISSLSGYGQATFHVVPDGTNITLGLRYTSDKVKGIGDEFAVISPTFRVPAIPHYERRFLFNKLTYKVAVDHKFAEHVLGYVSVSRGYKSGTFNTLPLAADPSRPETVNTYEVGLKSEMLDRRLRLNVAIFQNDIANPQVQTVLTVGNVNSVGLTNAKSARSKGLEFNSDLVLSKEFSLHLGGMYLDAKYRDFKNAPFYFPVSGAPYGNTDAILGDASGHRLAQVPKWRLTGAFDYDVTTPQGEFALNVNAAYTSRIAWDADNFLQQKGYVLLNASLTYQLPGNDKFSVSLWGKNLTNKQYYVGVLTEAANNGDIAAPAPPRTFGIELGYKF
jgi:iron complex outermembrane receptor protein